MTFFSFNSSLLAIFPSENLASVKCFTTAEACKKADYSNLKGFIFFPKFFCIIMLHYSMLNAALTDFVSCKRATLN